MAKIIARVGGTYSSTINFLKKLSKGKTNKIENILKKYGAQGVEKLSNATPKDTGTTAKSWSYSYSFTNDGCRISWENSNTNQGVPIIIFIQYGHITKSGGYVPANDFINPIIKPIVDSIIKDIWQEVINA